MCQSTSPSSSALDEEGLCLLHLDCAVLKYSVKHVTPRVLTHSRTHTHTQATVNTAVPKAHLLTWPSQRVNTYTCIHTHKYSGSL